MTIKGSQRWHPLEVQYRRCFIMFVEPQAGLGKLLVHT